MPPDSVSYQTPRQWRQISGMACTAEGDIASHLIFNKCAKEIEVSTQTRKQVSDRDSGVVHCCLGSGSNLFSLSRQFCHR